MIMHNLMNWQEEILKRNEPQTGFFKQIENEQKTETMIETLKAQLKEVKEQLLNSSLMVEYRQSNVDQRQGFDTLKEFGEKVIDRSEYYNHIKLCVGNDKQFETIQVNELVDYCNNNELNYLCVVFSNVYKDQGEYMRSLGTLD